MTRPLPPHGDYRRYWRGCRCRDCRTAAVARARHCAYLRDTGRPYLRDATTAADHLTRLRAAGMSDNAISAAAHITDPHLRQIIRRQHRIHADTERRILAVPIPPPGTPHASHVRVPAHGTIRRLRALVADGWPTDELAQRLDWHTPYLRCVLQGQRAVELRTLAAVRTLHAELGTKRPEEHGVPPARAARARQYAARKQWRDSVWWEDWGGIDDPAAPETEEQEKREEAARTLAADIRHLASFGVNEEEIARRVGRSRSYVHAQIVGIRGPGWRQQQEAAA